MSLVYRKRANAPSPTHWVYDYVGELAPFARRIDDKLLALPLLLLKSIEWGIYRWYRTPIRRFYGVKGNELIYMMTRRCSDRCAKCGIWRTPEKDDERLPLTHFINCLNRLHENLYQVTLTGGEPLVFAEDVLTIAAEATKLGVPMVTVTNGALLEEGFLQRYAALRHRLVISLDTIDREQWEAFRGREHHDRVMRNVHRARSILGNRLGIQSVLASESEEDVARVAAFCGEYGIPHTVQPYMDFGGSWHVAAECRTAETGACAARKNICVYPNGDVVKCFDHRRIPAAREPLGNIAEEDIVAILCKRRATEVSRLMKSCDLPCKQLSCNLPAAAETP
jgi:MoaA/NifB/PqqE/SkfB family radical SAM enzyme